MEQKDHLSPYAFDLDPSDMAAEKRRARELRASQWWKRRRDKGQCHWCGRDVPSGELTMDHIVPISRGGRSTKNNVVTACKSCNNKKKQLLPMEWAQYLHSLGRGASGGGDEQHP
jgi:hypothetical protein